MNSKKFSFQWPHTYVIVTSSIRLDCPEIPMVPLPKPVLSQRRWIRKGRRADPEPPPAQTARPGPRPHLQEADDWRVVVDGLAVDGLAHPLAVEGQLLHGLLLGEVRPLVEELARSLVLEARHVEEPRRGAHVRSHGDCQDCAPEGHKRGGSLVLYLQPAQINRAVKRLNAMCGKPPLLCSVLTK